MFLYIGMVFFGKGLPNPNILCLINNYEKPKIPKIDFIFRDNYINFEQQFYMLPNSNVFEYPRNSENLRLFFSFVVIFKSIFTTVLQALRQQRFRRVKVEFRINFRGTRALQNSILLWTALLPSMAAAIKV